MRIPCKPLRILVAVWFVVVAVAAQEAWTQETAVTHASVDMQMSGPPGSPVPGVSDDQTAELHEEPSHDPPWPQLGPVQTAPPVVVIRGSFESVQVNVDENGNDIRGDAANEPSMAVDPTDPDRIVIGWRQFDSINSDFRQAGYAYSHNGGKKWTFPGVLTPGVFRSDPVMDSDAEGNFYFYNIRCGSSGCGDVFKSTDGGMSWAGPFFAHGSDKVWMAIDRTDGMGRGHVYAAWGASFIRSTDGGRSFRFGSGASTMWGTVTVGPDGNVYTVGRAIRSFSPVTRSGNAQDPNQSPTFQRLTSPNMGGSFSAFRDGSPSPGGLLGQPWIKVDHSDDERRGNLYVLQSVNPPTGDPLDVMFAASSDDGRTWSGPVRVNDDPRETNAWQWFGAMSVAPNSGRIDTTWFDTRNSGRANLSELFYAYSTDGGKTWSENIAVTPQFDSWIGFPRQNKIGDYDEMISDKLGAMVAYSATFNGGQDVYFLRIDIDCNENGLHDGDDIASGRSKDVNGNGIPDECEGVNCDAIRRFTVKCKRNKLKVKVKSTQPEGTTFTIDNNGDQRKLTLNRKGKGKTKWTSQTGKHTAKIVECPDFKKVVDCG